MPRRKSHDGASAEIERWLANQGPEELRDLKTRLARLEAASANAGGRIPLWHERSFAVKQLAGMMLRLARDEDFQLKGLICAMEAPMSYATIGEMLTPAVGGERVRQLYGKLVGEG